MCQLLSKHFTYEVVLPCEVGNTGKPALKPVFINPALAASSSPAKSSEWSVKLHLETTLSRRDSLEWKV